MFENLIDAIQENDLQTIKDHLTKHKSISKDIVYYSYLYIDLK